MLSDDIILSAARKTLGSRALSELLIDVWKDGIDIEQPGHELNKFVEEIERAVLAKASKVQSVFYASRAKLADTLGKCPCGHACKASQQVQGEPEYHCLSCKIEHGVNGNCDLCGAALSVVSKAMATPKQEPVGKISSVFNQGAGHFFNCEWFDHCSFKEGDLLYAHPPQAAAIPEVMESGELTSDERASGYRHGWNDCRAAMLSAAPKPEGE